MASDSISARPMISAVWMRAAAPGCRPMASTAAATARPCPRPHRPEAIAIPTPAAMTANGPIHSPPAPGSAASARPGNASTAMPVAINERTLDLLLWIVGPSMMSRLGFAAMVLGFLDRPRDVEHRQHHENERLEKRHQDLQRIQEPDGEGDHHDPTEAADDGSQRAAGQRPADEALKAHQEEDDGQQDVAAYHVAEQPQRERQRPRQVADDLDDEHQRLECERHRPREVGEVGERALLA